MPTYEYRCTTCGNRVEVFQRIDAEPPRTCERCGGELRKVFLPAGIVFKGSGFYATDSRPKPKTTTDGDEKRESKPTEKKPTEKKPAEKKTADGEGSS